MPTFELQAELKKRGLEHRAPREQLVWRLTDAALSNPFRPEYRESSTISHSDNQDVR